MKSKISFQGHPLHPMLVALPIGLFIWTLVADFVYLATGKDKMWYDLAFWTGIAAWVTALLAAVPGLGDYLTTSMSGRARLTATAHMILNVSVVGLFFIATLLSMDTNAVGGTNLAAVLVLHILGVGILVLAGWLGGHLVYIHHLAVVEEGEMTEVTSRPEMRTRGQRMGPQAR